MLLESLELTDDGKDVVDSARAGAATSGGRILLASSMVEKVKGVAVGHEESRHENVAEAK